MESSVDKYQEFPLPFNINEITHDLRIKARLELGEDEEIKEKSLLELRNFLRSEKELRFYDQNDFLVQFLRVRKFRVQKAFELCKNYYTFKKNDLWGNIKFETVISTMKSNFIGFLPYRTPDGCSVFYVEPGKWDPDETPTRDVIQTINVVLMNDITFPASQIAGHKTIVNCRGMSYKQLIKLVRYVSPYMRFVQNGFPIRDKGVHVLNHGKFVLYFWEVVKLAVTRKFRERMFFHDDDMKSLHEHIPSLLLPEECGGELGPFDNSLCMKELMKFQKTFEEMQRCGYGKRRMT